MNAQTPHYLLMSHVCRSEASGQWRFVLRPVDGDPDIEVTDIEPATRGERLELLTVVRALEWLDQPSWVTLVGCSRYVEQGVQYGVAEWKDNGWRWEYFGLMTPVRDSDLWQRMDCALQFHRVDCRRRRCDFPFGRLNGPHWGLPKVGAKGLVGIKGTNWVKYRRRLDAYCGGTARMIAYCFREICARYALFRTIAGS